LRAVVLADTLHRLSNLILILQSAAEGNSKAAEELLPPVYPIRKPQ
jgi:hypothetical protein